VPRRTWPTQRVYVGILAWRYGSIAKARVPSAGLCRDSLTSITEYEHRQAVATGKHVADVLLDPEAEWPASQIDALAAGGGDAITHLRDAVSRRPGRDADRDSWSGPVPPP
jgi:hypothetical protein